MEPDHQPLLLWSVDWIDLYLFKNNNHLKYIGILFWLVSGSHVPAGKTDIVEMRYFTHCLRHILYASDSMNDDDSLSLGCARSGFLGSNLSLRRLTELAC